MKQIVLATRNGHKVRELLPLLEGLGVRVHTLEDFPHVGEVVEDGATLEENALKKARQVCRESTLPALADDSGLEVFYLNGEPGVYSSRYAGVGVSYAENRQKLLDRMMGVAPRRRGARFRCVIALVAPGIEKIAEGILEGTITEEPVGTGGFGYDPIFRPAGHRQTLAEMSLELKNTLSHRAQAVEKMKHELADYLRTGPVK
jgi:XTP/dITP diphosphohydrolase